MNKAESNHKSVKLIYLQNAQFFFLSFLTYLPIKLLYRLPYASDDETESYFPVLSHTLYTTK